MLITLTTTLFFCCGQKGDDFGNLREEKELIVFADSIFQGHIDTGNIAGCAVLIYKGEQKIIDKKYGYASLELHAPMPENPVFEIGSVTKQFTAAAILKLVEENRISLDDDITEYLDFNTQGRRVTINQLLNHTSGIASYTEIPEFSSMSLHSLDRDTMIRIVEKAGYLFEPGEVMSYNNSAYFFLGLIIENLTGKSYEMYLQEIFFTPLGMLNTSYCSNTKIVKNKVYGYSESPEGLVQKEHIDHTWPYAAGSLCSTAEDLMIWLKSLHSGKALSSKSYQKLITAQSLNDGTPLRYAMGILHYDHFGNEVIEHSGGINGFSSASRFYPEEDLYVICLKNSTGPNYIAENLVSAIIWKLIEKKNNPNLKIEPELIGFSGSYKGLVMGQQTTMELTVTPEHLILHYEGRDNADTVKSYIGHKTWMDGNKIITLSDDEVTMDILYGYFRLKKIRQ